MDQLAELRPYLEAASFVAGVTVAIVAAIGLRQLRLVKWDIETRIDRAAKEKAIEAASAYLVEFVALDDKYFAARTAQTLPAYVGPIGNFTPASVPPEHREKALAKGKLPECLPVLNRLEAIAAFFVTGVSDDQVGFEIIGRTFCSTVENHYDVIAGVRHDVAHPYFNNIVTLYRTWRPRLEQTELRAIHKALSDRLESIGSPTLTKLGRS